MQYKPQVEAFLAEHGVTDIRDIMVALTRHDKEWIHLSAMHDCFVKHNISFLKTRSFFLRIGTPRAIFLVGKMHYGQIGAMDIFQAITYFQLYCDQGNPDNDGHYWLGQCYEKLANQDRRYMPDYINYLHLCVEQKNSNKISAAASLGYKYQMGVDVCFDLCQSRYYYKLVTGANVANVELRLLDQFKTKLVPADYLLAYELKVIHEPTGLKDLQKLIENEYYNVLGLLKDLSNIVVSYLLYKN